MPLPSGITAAAWGGAGEFPLDSSKRYCAYLLEQAIAQLPEDCETILGIFDLRGFRTRNADFGFVRFLVRAPHHSLGQLFVC